MKFLGTTALSLILCWLFLKPHLTAQVSIFAPTAQADPSTTIELDVIVTDFANIGGISFSMNWNPEILEIQGIENFALPDINPGQNYNIIGDFDFFIRLSKIYKFKYVAKPVATYRIHKNNLSSKKKDFCRNCPNAPEHF